MIAVAVVRIRHVSDDDQCVDEFVVMRGIIKLVGGVMTARLLDVLLH